MKAIYCLVSNETELQLFWTQILTGISTQQETELLLELKSHDEEYGNDARTSRHQQLKRLYDDKCSRWQAFKKGYIAH